MEWNNLCIFIRGHHKEHFCDISFNLDQRFRRCVLKDFLDLELWRPSRSAKQNHLCNLGRGHYGERSCEIILNLDQCRGHLVKKFLRTVGQTDDS